MECTLCNLACPYGEGNEKKGIPGVRGRYESEMVLYIIGEVSSPDEIPPTVSNYIKIKLYII